MTTRTCQLWLEVGLDAMANNLKVDSEFGPHDGSDRTLSDFSPFSERSEADIATRNITEL